MKQVNKETYCVAMRGRYDAHGNTKQQLEPNHIDATNALTTVQKDNLILEIYEQHNSNRKHKERHTDI